MERDDEPLLQPGSSGKFLDEFDKRDDPATRDEDNDSIVAAVKAQFIGGEAMMVNALNFWSWPCENDSWSI